MLYEVITDVLTDDFINNLETEEQKHTARFLNRHIEIKIVKIE